MKTLKIIPQVVTDGAGHEVGVFFPVKDFKKLLKRLKKYTDSKAFDKAGSKKFITFVQAAEEILFLSSGQ
jgi:site-specific recombinase